MRKNWVLLLITILCLVNFVSADNHIDTVESDILRILGNIIKFAFSVLMILGSLLLIVLGIFLIVSGKEKYKILEHEIEARQAFLYLILGIVLLLLSFFIPNLIKDFIESSIKIQA